MRTKHACETQVEEIYKIPKVLIDSKYAITIFVGLGQTTSKNIQITLLIQHLSHCSEKLNVKFLSEDLYRMVTNTRVTSKKQASL